MPTKQEVEIDSSVFAHNNSGNSVSNIDPDFHI